MRDDPQQEVSRETTNIQRKLKTATGGMKTILENKLRDQLVSQTRAAEQTAMQDKIKADTAKLKEAALKTWDKKPKE